MTPGKYEICEGHRRRAACCHTCRHRIKADPFAGRHSCSRHGGEVMQWWTCDDYAALEV